jgi:hypothetical protein
MTATIEFTVSWAFHRRMAWDDAQTLRGDGLELVRGMKSGARLRVVDPARALAALKVPATMSLDGTWPASLSKTANRIAAALATV